MKLVSPLRYPGGKAALAGFLGRTIELNNMHECSYFEPFAGGAGAALRLLGEGLVAEIYLNDLDTRISAFWHAVLNETERFADAIKSVPVTLQEWQKQREICASASYSSGFELGFSTFYMNRCNRSGIIIGAGPIGGYRQVGKWKIGSRFYKETLTERIRAIGKRRDQIHISNMEARDFLLTAKSRQDSIFVYLDPPYYSKGNRLYMNSYGDEEHEALAKCIKMYGQFKWVMSYDDTNFIRDLYKDYSVCPLPTNYILQKRRREQELLISPKYLSIPKLCEPQQHIGTLKYST